MRFAPHKKRDAVGNLLLSSTVLKMYVFFILLKFILHTVVATYTVAAANNISYMPTLLDYSGVSQIQSEFLSLPYGYPYLPDKTTF